VPPLSHWVNGQLGGAIDATDRGFAYGDTLFETFRCHLGKVHLWDYHAERLRRGLETLDIRCSLGRVEQQLGQGLEWLREQEIEQAAGRLAVSRGPAGRGYRSAGGEPTLVLSLGEIHPWRRPHAPLQVAICRTRLGCQPALAGIKHGNRLEQVLAARELDVLGMDEGLQLNTRGELVCAVSGNILLVSNGQLMTPPIVDCGVAGTVRRLVLDELAPALGLPAIEKVLLPADLDTADELMVSNAVAGIRSVSRCGSACFTSTKWGDNLRENFYSWSESAA
jgi:4-amino-4-deoxychorismate lyase